MAAIPPPPEGGGILAGILEEKFASLLSGKDTLIVAYNAPFDLRFLNTMLSRHGLSDVLVASDFIDPMKVYRKHNPGKYNLGTAVLHYGLQDQVRNSHRACDDVDALIAVTMAMAVQVPYLEMYVESCNRAVGSR